MKKKTDALSPLKKKEEPRRALLDFVRGTFSDDTLR